eukprot:Gregarina_sp_Poly_1__3081@NODE_1868_length_3161_cov_173_799289_g1212_i0_p1_GENE_NODE_1868_length_3161_cov_173_799289_g1212_i0NODE_1868_length_3161_cov_173_799289_g1212_i0_p1_ORF_typecomplete_len229_score35_68_NODE_1868_length_3161_cov_173_799289_g1212_i019112597
MVQHDLLINIANLDNAEPPISWSDLEVDTSKCGRLLMVEGRAIEAIHGMFGNSFESENTNSGKPVIVVVLTQAISCYADEGNKEGILRAINLLSTAMPGRSIRALVPTKTWAPFDVVVAVAKSASGQQWRRRLQTLIQVEDLIPDMMPMKQLQQEDAEPQIDMDNQLKMNEPRAAETAGSFINAERRLIFTGVAIVMSTGALVAIIATANMQLNKDPLLYTKINTASH